MRFAIGICSMLSVAFIAGAVMAAGTQGLRPTSSEGRAVAERWCVECHVIDTDRRSGPDFGPPFQAIAHDPTKTESVLRAFLAAPKHPMPPLELATRDIDALILYFQSLGLAK